MNDRIWLKLEQIILFNHEVIFGVFKAVLKKLFGKGEDFIFWHALYSLTVINTYTSIIPILHVFSKIVTVYKHDSLYHTLK